MTRDPPLEPPSNERVADAVSNAVDPAVVGVEPIEEGLNATYRVDLGDGRRGVRKVATYATDAAELAEAAVVERLDAATDVPVPSVLATLPPTGSPLASAAYLMAYREGRQVTDVLELPRSARVRLVAEAGRHLAGIHGCPAPDGYGPLRVDDGSLAVADPAASWVDRFRTLAEEAVDGLQGGGVVTDDEPRFADLAATFEDALGSVEDALGGVDERAGQGVEPALLHGDYRPANLLLAADDDAEPLTRTVLDVGAEAGDPLLDVALAEDAMVDAPLGGSEEAARLRESLRTAYADGRARPREDLFDARYPYYRLLALARRLGAFGYWHQFAREDDPDAVARRFRESVRERVADVDAPLGR